ncbi:SAYSvFN domain-containing protein 1-like [Liolophura sinensis]|uniref:SAYSvFN domain-containing protein 1-like n=1 Tax=Liolophura sinensis TaxID=3198878 RepID=UPI003158D220
MEQKLAEYRARKSKEHQKYTEDTNWRTRFLENIGFRNRPTNCVQRKDGDPSSEDSQTPVQNIDNSRRKDDRISVAHTHHRKEEIQMPLTQGEKLFHTISLILKILLWVILWALFVEIGFGAVFFIVSSLIIIYRTMNSGSRDRSQLSAYSVFNPNFERLEGTFTAEQFEKELRYGAASVR